MDKYVIRNSVYAFLLLLPFCAFIVPDRIPRSSRISMKIEFHVGVFACLITLFAVMDE